MANTRDFVQAYNESNVDVISQYINEGVEENSSNEDNGKTALIYAAEKDNTAILTELIKAKNNVDIQDDKVRTALTPAVQYNREDCVRELISAKTDSNIKNNISAAALAQSLKNKQNDIAELMVKAGADIYIKDNTETHIIDYCDDESVKATLLKLMKESENTTAW